LRLKNQKVWPTCIGIKLRKSCLHARFTRWAKAGVWEKVFAELIKDRDNKYLMLDTTLVRVHQQAASGKGGPKLRSWGVPEVD
jgi:transposase